MTLARDLWRVVKLKDVCEKITVGHVGPMANEYVDEGIPFLRSQNIQPFHLDLADVKFITPEFHRKLQKSALMPGDVAIVRTGYPGTACVIPSSFPMSNCADLVIVRPSDELDGRFLAALFNSTWGRGHVAGSLVGVAQQHFNVGAAKEMEVRLPPISTQSRIADILSAYDDLIENNTRRIAVLEEMAQAIYREWFVNFRFPGHEQVEMVESELGLVPAGWEVVPLSFVALPKRRNVQPGNHPDEVFAHYSIPAFDSGRRPFLERGSSISSTKHLVEHGSVLISKLNPRIPRVWLSSPPSEHRSICSTEFVVLRPGGVSQVFLFMCLFNTEFHNRLTARAGGTSTSHQRVNPDDLLKLPLVRPEPRFVETFSRTVAPMLTLVESLRCKNAVLRRTRDLLLPRLISGEMEKPELEDELAEAVA